MINCECLKKYYKNFELYIKKLSINTGKVVSVCGENGCGKSVLLRLLAGIEKPSDGSVLVKNLSVFSKEFRYKSGVYLSEDMLIDFLRPMEYLNLRYSFFKKSVDEELKGYLELLKSTGENVFELQDYITDCSTGQKKRIGVCTALSHYPQIIILDEPFENIDEKSVRIYITILKYFKQSGSTIIFSSQTGDAFDNLVDDFIVLENGKITH